MNYIQSEIRFLTIFPRFIWNLPKNSVYLQTIFKNWYPNNLNYQLKQ